MTLPPAVLLPQHVENEFFKLDVSTKLVQYIKLAEQENGLGSEWVRAPRLPLVGAERSRVLDVVRKGIAERPDLPDGYRSADRPTAAARA